MNINIYYGGRGLIDDPTLFVINKMQEVLEELNQTISKYIFLDKIDINYIFDCQASNGKIKIHNLEELLNIYLEMSKEEKNALVYALACKFNS